MDFKQLRHGCDEPVYSVLGSSSTCAYYKPMYNEDGVNTNPDRNRTDTVYKCNKCKKQWDVRQQYGEEDIIMERTDEYC